MAFAFSCSDDSGPGPGVKDVGGGKKDLGGVKKDTGGTTLTEASIKKEGSVGGEKKPTADMTPNTCDSAIIGKPCTKTTEATDCGANHQCLVTSDTGDGICTCTCTPDDSNTVANEDTCPDPGSKNSCGTLTYTNGTTANLCLQLCTPKLGTNGCKAVASGKAPIACNPRSGAMVDLLEKAVCLFTGCLVDSDCPVVTSTDCSVATPTACTATGSKCLPLKEGADAGKCTLPGKCDKVSGLCDAHDKGKSDAKVGDPCKDDTQCAGNMSCFTQSDTSTEGKKAGEACTSGSDCCSSYCDKTTKKCIGNCPIIYRNGYCTIIGCLFGSTLTTVACTTGSTCNSLYIGAGGLCQKSCTLADAASCRGNSADYFGDYECRGWNNFKLASTPVCEVGPLVPLNCKWYGDNGIDCSKIGDSTNSTKMACKGLDNVDKSNKADPTGYCFDSTTSGSQIRNPLP